MWRKNGFHQSHAFSKIDFKLSSLLAQPLRFSFSQSISVILVVFLVAIWRPKKISLKSCPFPRRFAVLARCYPIKLFLVVQLFSSIRSISGVVFRLNYPEASISEHFFVLSFQIRSPIILYSFLFVRLHILPVLCSLISLRSLRSLASRFPQVSSCFSNSFRWFILFSSFVSIPMVARSRFFLLLSYQFIRSFQP